MPPKRTTPRWCKDCGRTEEEVEFPADKSLRCVVHAKKRTAELARIRNKKNPRSMRNNALRHRFNIGIDEYDSMHQKQNGVYAICKHTETRKSRSVKHTSLALTPIHF